MKVLALGAHPDDIEIFMYGTLLSCKKRGDEIFLAIATDGAAGGIQKGEKLALKRKLETQRALSNLGTIFFLNYPDGHLSLYPKAQEKIQNLIKRIKPDFIITHDPKDYHHDHRSLSLFTLNASSFTCPVLFCDTLMGINFAPEFYVDISRYFERKKNAILKHTSQNPEKLSNLASLMNSFRSGQCNRPLGTYAEAYRYSSRFPFPDIRNYLPPPPIRQPFFSIGSNSLI